MPVGPKLWIILEQTRMDLHPRRVARRIGHRRSAANAELCAVGRRGFAHRRFIGPDQIASLQQPIIGALDQQPGGKGRAANFAAAAAMTEFERTHGPGELEAHAAAKTVPVNHVFTYWHGSYERAEHPPKCKSPRARSQEKTTSPAPPDLDWGLATSQWLQQQL